MLGGYLPVTSSYKSPKKVFVQVDGVRDGTLSLGRPVGTIAGEEM